MKKVLIVLMITGCVFSNVFAQEYKELKNAGVLAFQEKKYDDALKSYTQSLDLVKQELTANSADEELNNQEKDLLYKIALCHYQKGTTSKAAADYKACLTFIDQAIAKEYYSGGNAFVYKANSHKQLKEQANMVAALKAGYEKAPDNKNLKKLLSQEYLKAGLDSYNKGVEQQKKANAATDAAKQKVELEKANVEFTKSLPFFENAYLLDSSETVLKALQNVYKSLAKVEATELEKLKTQKVNLGI